MESYWRSPFWKSPIGGVNHTVIVVVIILCQRHYLFMLISSLLTMVALLLPLYFFPMASGSLS